MKKIIQVFGYSVLLIVLLSLNSVIFAATTVNLIATNDMHGVLEASDTAVGISQVGAMKDSTENALLIDSGDATQGTTLATINEGADIIKLMNAAGYDCMVAGNHEFDFGSARLLANAELADFPILSANALTETGTLLPATTVIEKAGKRIGFVGITTSITNTATNPNLRPGVHFGDEITAAKKGIADLQGKVDTIVLLTHMGDNAEAVPVTSGQLLDGLSNDELSQVSAVLDGHSHTIESEPYTRGTLSIPVIQDQTQLTHVGKVAITFDDDGSVSATEDVMDYETAMAYPLTEDGESAKTSIDGVFSQIKADQDQITSRIIGQTETPLWGGYIYWDYAEPRIVETNFGDLVSDAFRKAAEDYLTGEGITSEVLGIVNGGGISNSVNPGPVTYGDILNSFNHGNTAVVLKSTPAELYTVIESGLRTTGQADDGMLERDSVSGSFIQCSGFKYTYDPAGAEGQKVTSIVTDNGTVLDRSDDTHTIYIGTQNYVQTFFSDAELVVNLGGEDSVISDYISGYGGAISMPTDGQRISVFEDKSPSTYTVLIPVYDKADTEKTTPLEDEPVRLLVDGTGPSSYYTNDDGYIDLELPKGPHTIQLMEADTPVYVNNYSGAGVNYTRDGYYSLSFSIEPGSYVPTQGLTASTDSVDLSTNIQGNTQTVSVTVSPADATDEITWTSEDEQVAVVRPSEDGKSAQIAAVAEGRTQVVVRSGNITEPIDVIVSNNSVVASDIFIDATTPDYYTVTARNVHINSAVLPAADFNVEQVSIFTWSDPLQVDMNCKVAEKQPGTNDYSFVLPVNNTAVNNFYFDASSIKINIYGSTEAGYNGGLIGAVNYNYVDSLVRDLALTPYCSNVGFITPSVDNGAYAGDPNHRNPLEGFRISTTYKGVNINATVHVQDLGWLPSVSSGQYAGTMFLNKPVEAVRLDLSGENADNYRLLYRTTAMDGSVSGWTSEGAVAGTTGEAKPLAGLEVTIEKVE